VAEFDTVIWEEDEGDELRLLCRMVSDSVSAASLRPACAAAWYSSPASKNHSLSSTARSPR
jgi:hypothetical protein